MRRVLPATLAKLAELKPPSRSFLVLRGRVVAFFALAALQCHDFSHIQAPRLRLAALGSN